jgi:hypothetical protein
MFKLITICCDQSHISIFSEKCFEKTARNGMLLTDRIPAQNFRLRESMPGYFTDWHLSGDPTLIIIQKGILRISLQNGIYKDFKSGDMFIAADNLPENIVFDPNIHGHRAEVFGDETLLAVHIKLADWETC